MSPHPTKSFSPDEIETLACGLERQIEYFTRLLAAEMFATDKLSEGYCTGGVIKSARTLLSRADQAMAKIEKARQALQDALDLRRRMVNP